MTSDLAGGVTELNVALVVGAGGPTGGPFIYAALDELERATGWMPPAARQIVGTSAGAFVAASFDAASRTPVGSSAALAALANGHRYAPRLRHRMAASGRHVGGRIVAFVAPKKRPSAEYRVYPPPYHPGAQVVTVVRWTGRRMVHDLTEAADVEAVVRASSAIPAVNAPVAIDGRLHVDGAVYSATNSDVADHEHIDLVVIVAPMIPASGGSIASRLHRAQLRTELAPWLVAGRSALVIMPSEATHAERRDRERFTAAGIIAIEELVSAANRG